MSRLPQPGSDDDQWGDILNEFLRVSHDSDGTLKEGAISSKADNIAVVHLSDDETIAGQKTFSDTATFSSSLSMDGTQIVGVGIPTNDSDAATKGYVDAQTVNDTLHVLKTGDTMTGALVVNTTSNPGVTVGNGTTGILKLGDQTLTKTTGSEWVFSGGNIRPSDNNFRALGTASNYFSALYASRHYFNSTAYLDGATAGRITSVGQFWMQKTHTSISSANPIIIQRAAPSTDAQSITFGAGLNVDYHIGRLANSDDLVFGTDGGSGFTEKVRFSTGGAITSITGTNTGAFYLNNSNHGLQRRADGSTRDVEVFTDGAGASFFVSTNGAGSREFTVLESGRTGIGTSSPLARLDLRSGADNIGGGGSHIAFQYEPIGGYRHWIRTKHDTSASAGNSFDFFLNNTADGSVSTAPGTGNSHIASITGVGVGILTQSPTNTLTLGSTATGIAQYNTTDQTTNYERSQIYWGNNELNIITEKGGTGTARGIKISSSSAIRMQPGTGQTVYLANDTSGPFVRTFVGSTFTAAQTGMTVGGSWQQSSGSSQPFAVTPTISQSSTAGYTALLVNVAESATGSGSKRLLDLQVDSLSKFSVDNTGGVTLGGAVVVSSTANPGLTVGTTGGGGYFKLGDATLTKQSGSFFSFQNDGVQGVNNLVIGLNSAVLNRHLYITGALSSASWSTAGPMIEVGAATITDTSAAGTRTIGVANSLAQPTFAATNAATTITDAATLYIANAPTSGTNMAVTNAYALWVDNGAVRLDGALQMNADMVLNSSARLNMAGGTNNDLEYLYSPSGTGAIYFGARNNIVYMADNDNNGGTGHVWKVGNNTKNSTSGAIMYLDTTGLGLGTQAPTHSVTLASTATGIAFYNTSDQTTNFSRARTYWSSNELVTELTKGGSATAGNFRWVASDSARTMTLGTNAVGTPIWSLTTVSTGVTAGLASFSGTFSGAAAAMPIITITPTISQSSTSGYTALQVNVTENTTGSGSKLLADFQIGGSSKLSVTNAGTVTLADAANLVVGTTTGTKIGTSSSQKLGFYNATPIAQPNGDILVALAALGLVNAPSVSVNVRSNTLTVSGSTYTPNSGTTDLALIVSPSANFTVASPTGTPADGQKLTLRIKSGATGYIPTWDAVYLSSGAAALSTTTLPASKTVTFGFTYDLTATKWVLLAADTIGY